MYVSLLWFGVGFVLRFTRLFIVVSALTGAILLQAAPQPVAIAKSQHHRMPVTGEIQRLAVGDPDIVSAEPITDRELLILGKGFGRTSVIVWFRDGRIGEYLFIVKRDLSVLENALRRVHPDIDVESAPDRDAVVLTGTVPDYQTSQAAEGIARNYLEAGIGARTRAAQQQPAPVVANPTAPSPEGLASEIVRLATAAPSRPTSAVINLLRLEKLPETIESRLETAIRAAGAAKIKVRRVLRGTLRDDAKDVFVLEGTAPNQVALTRSVALAAQVLTGRTASEDDIRVIADESGALVPRNLNLRSASAAGGGGGGAGGGGGGFTPGSASGNVGLQPGRLFNQIGRNLARAKAIEAADGRLISFVQVVDLPQVRVDIKLYEVNRTKLRNYNPNTVFLGSQFRTIGLNPAAAARTVQEPQQRDQGPSMPRVGDGGRTTVQDVFAFLGGTLSNQMQFASPHFAVDQVMTLLERDGIAKSLSSPSLTVLSGEQALFQVGGEIPIPEAFAPFFGTVAAGGGDGAAGAAPGLYSFVVFRPFGIQLGVRPLIGEDDKLTIDVVPSILNPSAELTTQIRQSTGTNPLTTAFESRALRTSARLDDGQALIIGGLLTRQNQERNAGTPRLKDAPGLGWLFKSFERTDEGLELVLVVNPAILRDPVPGVPVWQFGGTEELIQQVTALIGAKPESISLQSAAGASSPAAHTSTRHSKGDKK